MIIFTHIPKTAGSTFQFILENNYGISACNTNHIKKDRVTQKDLDFAFRFYPFMKSISGHNLKNVISLNFQQPYHVTFLRNPHERTISHYQDHIISTGSFLTFEDWFKDKNLHNTQVKHIAGDENLEKAKENLSKFNFVGLTEYFDLSLHLLKNLYPKKLNYNYLRKRTHHSTFYKDIVSNNSEYMKLVKKYNYLDNALYNFACLNLFPDFCKKGGLKQSGEVNSFNNYNSKFYLYYNASHFYNNIFRAILKFKN